MTEKTTPPLARKIVVTLGGSDPDNATVKVMHALASCAIPGLEVTVIVGGSSEHLAEVKTVAAGNPIFTVVHDAKNMSELLAWADMGVAAAGGTTWEFLRMGVPIVSGVLAENQEPNAAALQEKNLAVSIGWYKDVSDDDLRIALRSLITNADLRRKMSALGKEVVDGKGAERVLHMMLNPKQWTMITGASGLLGANLALTAVGRGLSVIGVHHQHAVELTGVQNLHADLTNVKAARDLVLTQKPTVVIHCAAATNVDWCEDHRDETWAVNVEMTKILATTAKEIGARFVYVSTDSVFDGEKGNYSEDDVSAPLNVYAESKLAGEQAAREVDSNALIIRTNLYGWNVQKKQSLGEWVVGKLRTGESVPGFTDVFFSTLVANDLSDIILDLIEKNVTGLFHAGASDACSKYDFAVMIAKEFGFPAERIEKTSVKDAKFHAKRPRDMSLNTAKISQKLGRPMPTVAEGVARFKRLEDEGFAARVKSMFRSS